MREMKWIAYLILWGLLVTLIGALFIPSGAKASTADYVSLSAKMSLGTDSSNYAIDSVVFRALTQRTAGQFRWTWLGKGSKATIATASDNSGFATDSLCWVLQVPIDSMKDYNSSFAWIPDIGGWVYWNDGTIDRADVDVRPIVAIVDSLDQTVSTTLSQADRDTIAATVDDSLSVVHGAGSWTSAAGGTGPDTLTLYVYNTADTSGVGAAQVSLYPNDGGTKLTGSADANGRIQFGASKDTLLGYAWISGWYQASPVPDTFEVTADVADTLWMTQVTAASPSSPALTAVTFNFKDLVGDSIKNVDLYYHLYTKSSQVYHMDSTKVFDYTTIYSARTDSSGGVTVNVIPNDSLLTEGNRTGQTWWVFQAYEPSTGKKLLSQDGLKLKINASASGLVWPEDF